MERHHFRNLKRILTSILIFAAGTSCIDSQVPQRESEQGAIPTISDPSPNTIGDNPTPIILSPQYEAEMPNVLDKVVFFSVRRQKKGEIEIWQTNIDGSEQSPLFSVPITYPVSMLPTQELVILQKHYCGDDQSICPQQLDYGIHNLELSPDKKVLAWIESILWCPTTSCYGLSRIVTRDLAQEHNRILLEVNQHIDETRTQRISSIVWSPDSKQIGFEIGAKIYIVDILTDHVQEVGDGQAPLAWDPNGSQIAMTTWVSESQGWGIKIVGDSGTFTITNENNKWDLINGINWFPDGSKLAVIALANYDTSSNNSAFSIPFIIDLPTKNSIVLQPLPDDAVSYNESCRFPNSNNQLGLSVSGSDENDRLIIFNLQTEVVEANLELGLDISKCIWSDDGNTILMLFGDKYFTKEPFNPERMGLFHWQSNHLDIIPLLRNLEEELLRREAFISSLTW